MRRLRGSAALAVSAFLGFGWLLTASTALAADPSIPPLTPGHHVVDGGGDISPAGLNRIDQLASHIEAAGGGKIAIYTAPELAAMPSVSDLAAAWATDGLVMTYQNSFGHVQMGATLKAKLTSEQQNVVTGYDALDAPTAEAWCQTMLARIDGFVNGTRVFDGAGVLDASGKQQAEKAARDLSDSLGAPVYVDIAYDGTDPSERADNNGADLASNLRSALIIAIGVSDSQIGGFVDTKNDKISQGYDKGSLWNDSSHIWGTAFMNGDRQATVLSVITGISKKPFFEPWVLEQLVVLVLFTAVTLFLVIKVAPPLVLRLTGVPGTIKNGRPGEAVIESIEETGITVTMASVGPNAPEYKFGLEVYPDDGGPRYHVDTKALVPRIYLAMVAVGGHVGVEIDPKNPKRVNVDFAKTGGRIRRVAADEEDTDDEGGTAEGSGSEGAESGFAAAGAGSSREAPGKVTTEVKYDRSGRPLPGQIENLVGAVRSGKLPTINGSADQLLATGTHGTAVVTSAEPMGKKVRDLKPDAPADRLNDPMWVFTVMVKLPGQSEFPAVFGHRVPVAKLADIGPGTKLAVAVDESDKRNPEVAIDWAKSPLP